MAKAKPGKSPGRSTEPKHYYCSVAGVTFEGRQRLVRKHCRDGDEVRLKPEPKNRHSRHAVGVWVRKRAWIFRGWVKVGYIPEGNNAEMFRLLQQGWVADASIDVVVGGGWFKNRGLRLKIRLRVDEWETA